MDVQPKDDEEKESAGSSNTSSKGAHLAKYQFQPGQSGNPKGRAKVPNEVKRLAREASPRAMSRLVELIESDDERVAMMAAKEVLDRAYGKVKAEDEDDKAAKNVTINIVKLTDDRDHATPQLEAKTVPVRVVALS